MTNTFEFVGKITPCKETDTFKPYGTTQFPNSDWGKKQIRFNVIVGTNRHIVECSELINCKSPNSATIYTVKKVDVGDGRTVYEKLQVPMTERFNSDLVQQIAGFKKYVVDTERPGKRTDLEAALAKFTEGTITTEQMEYLGIHGLEECQKAIEASAKKRQEFIYGGDYIDRLNEIVNNPKIKDMMFRVTGNIEFEYSEAKDMWYRKFNVTRVIRVADDSELISKGNFDFVFGRDAIDDSNFDETKKITVSGFVEQYLGKYKKEFFCPISLSIDGSENENIAKAWSKKFAFPAEDDSEYREIGLVTTILNGSQKVELTMDMLTDEQRENVEFGFCTLEDIAKEIGGDIYGDRVQDIVISALARGWSKGAKPTSYEEKDFARPHNELDDDDMDIFDDDDI